VASVEGYRVKGRVVSAVVALALTIAGGLVQQLEGTRYKAYPDPATRGAPWTICEGHTKGVKPGDTATPAQCEAWRKQDLAEANDAVDRCISTPLSANERGALIVAVINAGPSIVCGSTLQRKANAGDHVGMCAELSRWVYANGKAMPGLVNRQATVRAVCEKNP
jgi:lysozyme